MSRWENEQAARQEILSLVSDYYHTYKEEKEPFQPGQRITYAGRVFDEKEMCSLVESALDFWLTTGRYAEDFEREFAKYLGIRYASLVNRLSRWRLVSPPR